MPSATDLLREDHRKVKALFREFEEADSSAEKRRIANECFMELEIHSQIEEEIFYPAIRRQDKEEMAETMNEADEEHHVVDLLIAEMKKMRPSDPRFEAKFTVMAENVKHHIQEEESEIFTKAAEAGGDHLQRLGEELEERKMELMAQRSQRRSGSTAKTGSGARKRSASGSSKRATGSKNGARRGGRTMTKTARKVGSTARKAASTARGATRKASGTARRSGTSTRARKTTSRSRR